MSGENPIVANLESLENIIRDILQRGNKQVLGNLEVLEHDNIVELNQADLRQLIEDMENVQAVAKFELVKSVKLQVLIRDPVKMMMGRVAGLLKVVARLRAQLDGDGSTVFPVET